MNDLTKSTIRRFELDWLRVLLVLCVFLHHAAMPFNGDKFHIMNSQSSKLLDDLMVFFEQWRLPLLLFISGAGTVMAFSNRNSLQFIKERSKRLLLPFIFGVLVIVPPQTYYQFIGKYSTYLDVYPGVILKPESNHLWFINFLFAFALLSIPLILFLRSDRSQRLKQWIEWIYERKMGAFAIVIPLMLIMLISKFYFPGDSKKLSNLSVSLYYYFFFAMGAICSVSSQTWKSLERHRHFNLILFLVSIILFYGYYYFPDEIISKYVSIPNRWNLWWIACCLVGWTTILTVLGYAQVFLNKTNNWLPKLNEAVYPFYILHQTAIVIIGYYIIQWETSIAIKLTTLVILSFISVVLVYRFVVYPYNLMRVLFGMKRKE